MSAAVWESAPLPAARARRAGSGVWIALGAAPLAALFALVEPRLSWVCHLPEASYFEPVIAAQLAQRFVSHRIALAAIAAVAALVALRRAELWRGWRELEHGRALRLLIGGLALAFAWTFSTYQPNFYFGQTHALDRALLVAFALLTCWRPAFLLLFLPELLAVIWQFDTPLGGYSFTDKNAPLRVLILFLVWFLGLAAVRGRRTEPFVFAALCLVAAHYWIPALEKLQLGWLGHGHLHHLTLAAWQNGWLASLDRSQITAIALGVAKGELFTLGFTIAAEAGALFFLLRRGVALALLGSWILLHAGIFATSGIFFWKWMLLDVGLFAVLVAIGPDAAARIFGPLPLLCSLVLITGAAYWCPPVRLGWYDTRVADTYRYTAIGESGAAYPLAASFFAPYDMTMAQNRLGYLSRRPVLVSTYGMTQTREIAEHLFEVTELAEVETLEARFGVVQHDPARALRFDAFARRALAAKAGPGTARPWYTVLHPPIHIQTAPRGPALPRAERVERLIVERVTTLWDGERFDEVRVERVRELALGAPAGA
jgi:hypothetical protein